MSQTTPRTPPKKGYKAVISIVAPIFVLRFKICFVNFSIFIANNGNLAHLNFWLHFKHFYLKLKGPSPES